jgi:hypothetical protein
MKKLIQKPFLLLCTLGAVIGLGLVPSQSSEVKAQTDPKWCDWIDSIPGYPWDGCKVDMLWTPCICEDQC